MSAASNLAVRVVSGAAGIAIVLAVVFAGLWPLAVFCAVVAGLGAWELVGIMRSGGTRPNQVLGAVFAASFPIAAAAFSFEGMAWAVVAAVVVSLLWLLAFFEATVEGTALTLAAALYVGLLLSFLVLIRQFDDGLALVLITFVGTWIADVAAYGVGLTVGKHKLAPKVSPGKTWEGSIGGFLITVVLFTAAWFVTGLSAGERALLGALIAVSGAFGDLVESRIKRQFEVKDSGGLIPGHGGVLDRFDSLLFVAPTVYVFLQVVGWLG